MKKIITLLLTMAVSSAVGTTAMAAGGINGFYDIESVQNVTISPKAGDADVTASEKNIDDDDAMENVYVDSNRLDVTYSGATANEYYGILLVEGKALPTIDTEIYYINQETAASSSIAFNVFPKLPSETTDMTLYISTSKAGAGLVSVPMSYAVNASEAVEHEHTWDEGVVTLEPTVDAEGVMTYTCSGCGEQKTETIDKLPAPTYRLGDTNGDGEISVKDVVPIRRTIAGGYTVEMNEAAADVNQDGTISVKDVVPIRRFIAGGYGVEL